jgi:hypothetical protein
MPNAVSTNSKPYDSLKGNDIVSGKTRKVWGE